VLKTFTIFDENFEIGRVRNTTFSDYATLKNFNPGSMTKATLNVQVTLDPNNTGWGVAGRDEFDVSIWMNNSAGDPTLEVVLGNNEFTKMGSAEVTPAYGDNVFTLRIDHGKVNEGGHAKGHVKVWLNVEYSDPNNPPGGNEPVTWIEKIKQFIQDHPMESALIGLAGLFAYDQYSGGSVRELSKKGTETVKKGGQVVVNIITSEQAKKAAEKAKELTGKATEKAKQLVGGGKE